MGTLLSKFPEIKNIRFVNRTNIKSNQLYKATHVIRLTDGLNESFMVRLEDGSIYFPQLDDRYAYVPSPNWWWTKTALRALVQLGIITKEDAEGHQAYVAQWAKERDERRLKKRFREIRKEMNAFDKNLFEEALSEAEVDENEDYDEV